MSNEQFQSNLVPALDIRRLVKLQNQFVFQALFPKGFTYFRLNKKQLHEYYGELQTFNKVAIQETRLLVETDNNASINFAIYLKLVTGQHFLFPIAHFNNELEQLFTTAGRYFPLNFTKNRAMGNWKDEAVSTFYDEKISSHYRELHWQIKEALKVFIEQNELHELNVVDGGCGRGEFLEQIGVQLAHDGINVQLNLFGFDLNSDNVSYVTTEVVPKAPCRVEVGDLTRTDEVLKRFSEKDPKLLHGDRILNLSTKTAVVLSGSLTYMVLPNGFTALQALHSIVFSGAVDFLIGGGLGLPFINHYIAKQIGFKKKIIDQTWQDQHLSHQGEDKENTRFFVYERMSIEELLKDKIKKLQIDNELDLALSPQPEIILKALLKKNRDGELSIAEDVVIDCSFAAITDSFIVELQQFLENFPKARLVLRHYNEQSIKLLSDVSELKSRFAETPVLVSDDMYMTSSTRFFNASTPPLSKTSQVSAYVDNHVKLFKKTEPEEDYLETICSVYIQQVITLLHRITEADKAAEEELELIRNSIKFLSQSGVNLSTLSTSFDDSELLQFIEKIQEELELGIKTSTKF